MWQLIRDSKFLLKKYSLSPSPKSSFYLYLFENWCSFVKKDKMPLFSLISGLHLANEYPTCKVLFENQDASWAFQLLNPSYKTIV